MNLTDEKHKKAKEISPNIFWIDGGSSNLYLCKEESGLTLIDAGVPNREKLVFEVVAALGHRPSDIQQIVITHADPDHVGSLAAIQKVAQCPVYASRETAVYLKSGSMPKHLPAPIQYIAERIMKLETIDPSFIQLVVDDDVLPILDGLYVIATPGHTLDHHAYFSPIHGVMFCGDALHTRKGPIQASSDFISADRKKVIQSARRILNYSPAVIASGHGVPSSTHSSDDLMRLFNQFREKEANL